MNTDALFLSGERMEFIEMIKNTWPLAVAGGTIVLVVYAAIRFKIPDHERRLKKLETAGFITLAHLEKHQAGCQSVICGKIDTLKAQLGKMNRERDEARGQHGKQLNEIFRFMGRVDQYMRDHNGK